MVPKIQIKYLHIILITRVQELCQHTYRRILGNISDIPNDPHAELWRIRFRLKYKQVSLIIQIPNCDPSAYRTGDEALNQDLRSLSTSICTLHQGEFLSCYVYLW